MPINPQPPELWELKITALWLSKTQDEEAAVLSWFVQWAESFRETPNG